MAGIERAGVCVVVPAFNEEASLEGLVRGVQEKGFDVLVVDDGSSDQTLRKAEALKAKTLALPANGGKGTALRKAFEWLLRRPYSVVVLMDADGQHDPSEIDRFLCALGRDGVGVAVGNRMHDPEGMPWIRRLTNRFLSWILSRLTGQNIPDSQCGYRAMKREVLESITLTTARFETESEMLLEAARKGFAIGSVPIRCVYHGGKSRIHPLADTWRFFRFLAGYLLRRRDDAV
ncbi:MAG: glycosyltransferase family 2 protein [Candidatus Omnitrophica bacterium]|nr:glycosyltransferase family 2 protein [Candidatus Omnitrophota bacterium]